MPFIIDEQTRSELSLTGRHQPGTVYHLFNTVKTKRGGNLLEELLSKPLDKTSEINDRATIFRRFGQLEYQFPIDPMSLDIFVGWFDESLGRSSWHVWSKVIQDRFLSLAIHHQSYEYQINGLKAGAKVFRMLVSFLESSISSDAILAFFPDSFKIQVKQTVSSLKAEYLQRLMIEFSDDQHDIGAKNLVYYTHLLKNVHYQSIRDILAFITHLDVFIAVGAIAKDRGLGYAVALDSEENICRIYGLGHPLLKNAVRNNLALDSNHRMFFLTGANMAGKSTLMKSFGIAVYLAHTGFPVPANAMEFTIKDGLCTSINVPDNISLGYSHYYAEVLRVKEIAGHITNQKSMVVICDELFKGTNVKDAYDGTLAVTKAFAQYQKCLFMVSTHIIEVANELAADPAIIFGFMPTRMNKDRPEYTFLLTPGVTADRHGMLIIKAEGILELLS